MYYVELDGGSYAMKYGHEVLRKFMHKYGLKRLVELEQLPGKLTIDDMPSFVKGGFDTAAKILGADAPFSLSEVTELLESYLWLETAAIEAFAESIQKPQTKREENEKRPEEVAEPVEEGN